MQSPLETLVKQNTKEMVQGAVSMTLIRSIIWIITMMWISWSILPFLWDCWQLLILKAFGSN
jgi:hypothetical protein